MGATEFRVMRPTSDVAERPTPRAAWRDLRGREKTGVLVHALALVLCLAFCAGVLISGIGS
jgi:hypothetical protein